MFKSKHASQLNLTMEGVKQPHYQEKKKKESENNIDAA
jgi:hypothetical protein